MVFAVELIFTHDKSFLVFTTFCCFFGHSWPLDKQTIKPISIISEKFAGLNFRNLGVIYFFWFHSLGRQLFSKNL